MPVWISHRGVRDKGAEENSIAAFKRAVELGFSDIETDLHCSLDGEIILSHDPSWSCGAEEIFLPQATIGEIKSFTSRHNRVLTLWQDFAAQFGRINWTLDLKEYTAPQVIETLSKQSTATTVYGKPLSQIKFLVWRKEHERLIKQQWPEARLYAGERACYLYGFMLLCGLGRCLPSDYRRTISLPPSFAGLNFFTSSKVENLHRKNLGALAFLPHTKLQLEQALKSGFDEILVDYVPEVMSAYFARRSG